MTEYRPIVSPGLKNTTAIAYVVVLYFLGVTFILLPTWQLNALGVLAIVHSLVISTALTHELIHGNIFKGRLLNGFWGQVMTHFNGACYAPWDTLVEHHFNHHLLHVDVVRFDVVQYLNEQIHPWQRWLYTVLEWLYFPILEFEMRWRMILDPWLQEKKRHLWKRVVGCGLYRTLAFGTLAWFSWKALLLYFLAYISFVNVNRFVDAFHHTYEYAIAGEDLQPRNRDYEQEHTFSNLLSLQYPWLNLLFLNFGYHNAHHHQMSCPWHELPALHNRLYGEQTKQLLPLPQLIGNYHRFRLQRLFSGQGDVKLLESAQVNLESFTGGVAVSLLTPP